jgi:site-specific recombinase XerD
MIDVTIIPLQEHFSALDDPRAHQNRLVLGQRKVHEKSNEIRAIPELLKVLDLAGAVVSIDAMGCQTAIAAQIVAQQGDYVLALKGNQGNLHQDVRQLFDLAQTQNFRDIEHDFYETEEKGHGRQENRRYWVMGQTDLELDELELLLGEIESQLNQAKTNKQRLPLLRDRVLVGIMSLEGCRIVELHNLKLEQILHQGQRTGLKVFAKRASRIVPLTNSLTQQLEEYLLMRRTVLRRKTKSDDYVFVSLSNNSKNQQLSRRSICAIVDRYLIATGLKYKKGRTLSAHSLRHTAGTQALRAGADLRQVQDLLGHADPRTTSILCPCMRLGSAYPSGSLGT